MNADGKGQPPDRELWLKALGQRLRAARKALGVSAVAAAQAAGVSRVTWHRMEAGAPGVAAGSYARALDALGLADLDQADGVASVRAPRSIPTRITVGDYPELRALAWSLQPGTQLTPRQVLDLYDTNARYLDAAALTDAERTLIEDLREALADDVHP
ncbi:MAG: helix-turn-helix domain-containing protein [Actinomycetota bacterium]|nr:helix-turn-helix domain-containing protein [Actinomycetota bacterium]